MHPGIWTAKVGPTAQTPILMCSLPGTIKCCSLCPRACCLLNTGFGQSKMPLIVQMPGYIAPVIWTAFNKTRTPPTVQPVQPNAMLQCVESTSRTVQIHPQEIQGHSRPSKPLPESIQYCASVLSHFIIQGHPRPSKPLPEPIQNCASVLSQLMVQRRPRPSKPLPESIQYCASVLSHFIIQGHPRPSKPLPEPIQNCASVLSQ